MALQGVLNSYDFFTMIFRITGLPDEKARFQVISTGEEKQ